MEIILLVLLVVMIFLIVILIILFLFKKNNIKIEGVDKKDLDLLQSQLSEHNTKIKGEIKDVLATNIQTSSNDLKQTERYVKEWIESQSKETQRQLTVSNQEVRQLLNSVKEQSEPVVEIKEKVAKLDNLLSQNNKAGKAGEYLLERIFTNLTGINKNSNLMFERQYKLKKQEEGKDLVVDLFIKGDGSKFVNIPVDAKFPFNAYQELLNHEVTSDEFKRNEAKFKTDVKNRIAETSKYVSDEDRTVYSIMFIPSEGVFSYINSMPEIIDAAFNKKVIIAGPSTLIAILQSIDKYMTLFDNIDQFDKKVEILEKTIKFLDNYDEQIVKLFKTIETLSEQYEAVKTKENSLKKQYEKLIK